MYLQMSKYLHGYYWSRLLRRFRSRIRILNIVSYCLLRLRAAVDRVSLVFVSNDGVNANQVFPASCEVIL